MEVAASAQSVPLIPASATSCLAQRQASTGTTPTSDVSASYFRVAKLTFTKKNKANDMYIDLVRITVDIPGISSQYVCTVGGDALAALNATWYGSNTSGHQAYIPAGTESMTTDCALYCGGIDTTQLFSATATMEIRGYEQAPGSDEQNPVRTTTYFTVIND
ncbi:hypothetical protein DOE51_04165 [Bdellovibrio sp. NC01]|nr:hypothetical protein DOE51_04165 [Bdellovibrio sp. NC01]